MLDKFKKLFGSDANQKKDCCKIVIEEVKDQNACCVSKKK
jgi:hypothetical protein